MGGGGGGQRETKAIQVKLPELVWVSQAPSADNTGANVLTFAQLGPPVSAAPSAPRWEVCVCIDSMSKRKKRGGVDWQVSKHNASKSTTAHSWKDYACVENIPYEA